MTLIHVLEGPEPYSAFGQVYKPLETFPHPTIANPIRKARSSGFIPSHRCKPKCDMWDAPRAAGCPFRKSSCSNSRSSCCVGASQIGCHCWLSTGSFWVGVCHLFPKARDVLGIVRPDTVVRWHHAGFRLFWRWKSRRRLGRPAVPTEIQQLSIANPLWGAPRIHGELLRLGVDAGSTRYVPPC